MANINLLPWREELRKEKTRQFTSMLGFAVLLTVGVFVLIQVAVTSQINHQQKRNKILQDEIDQLDIALQQIEGLEETKEKLLSRMDIYLTGIKQSGNSININGVAESNGRVSAYMRNIDGSDWMATPKLSVIESKKGSLRSSDFVLTTSQSTPKSDEEEEG
jgi:type IV pilus assembly protein PilN